MWCLQLSLESKLVETNLELEKKILQNSAANQNSRKLLTLFICYAYICMLRGDRTNTSVKLLTELIFKCIHKNCTTYAILAHTEHFQCPSAPTTRHLVHTLSLQVWHRSPLSKIKPRLFWQRIQTLLLSCWQCRFPPFLLTSRSSFFNFLEERK